MISPVPGTDQGMLGTRRRVAMKSSMVGELPPNVGLFSRSVLRFYMTHAKWSDEFRRPIGGTTYEDETYNFAIGMQMASWW
jgi:maltoporin